MEEVFCPSKGWLFDIPLPPPAAGAISTVFFASLESQFSMLGTATRTIKSKRKRNISVTIDITTVDRVLCIRRSFSGR